MFLVYGKNDFTEENLKFGWIQIWK